jgi:trehalose/maltose hydrolase-like predicted phosphorylase
MLIFSACSVVPTARRPMTMDTHPRGPGRPRGRAPGRRTLCAFTGLALAALFVGAAPASAAPAGSATTAAAGSGPAGSAQSAAGWVLSTTDTASGYSPTFVGNGYLSARVPAAGEGYSTTPIVTQSELAGFYGKDSGSYEQRASLPAWTTLGFGDGSDGGEYGVPGAWACSFDEICPAAYGQISGGAFVETSHANSTVGGYLAGLNTNNQPTVGGTGVVPVTGAPAGPATVAIRYSNASGSPQTFTLGVNGVLQQLTVPSLASWDDWAVLDVPVTLAAGNDSLEITITAADSGRVNVDYLAAYPTSATAPTAVAPATAGTTSHYEQSLDMRTGTLTTSFDWTSLGGRRTTFTYTVNANRATGHLGTVSLLAVPHWSGTASTIDEFDGQGLDHASAQHPSVNGSRATLSENVVSDGGLVTAALSSVLRVGSKTVPTTATPAGTTTGQVATFPVKANHAYRITKFVGVASSVDTDRSLTAATPQQYAAATAASAAASGYAHTVGDNDGAWAALWSSDITIPGDTAMTAQVRAAMFYLLESMRAGVTWSTSPGGLSSDGYNGHVFWDMETWMYPSLLAQYPDIAVGADTYRQKLLPQAEAAAAALSTPGRPIAGAKFPWESALTGEEAIPPGNPEGAEEIHIDSDIALAQWQYYEASGDKAWLREKAWPVLQAIAEYWASRAVADPNGGYDIDNVQGPDEYYVGVDDNATTNAGAQASLRIATEAAGILGLPADPSWTTVADGLKIPFDPATGIHLENDGYTGQTIKQADVTLLQYPWNVPMSPTVAQNDLDYYAGVTDPGGPSMTDAIASIDSSALGTPGCSAYTYMLRSADPFIAAPYDQFDETRTGGAFTFTTGEGGYLQEFLYGFTGLRWETGSIEIDPSLPPQLPGVDLTGLKWQGRVFDLTVGQKTTELHLVSGTALPVTVADGSVRTVRPGATLTIPTRQTNQSATTDLARCRTVGASSADPSYPAVGAVDGTGSVGWSSASGATGPQWIEVDLGKTYHVSRVTLDWGSAYAKGYQVQTSTDGETWTTIYSTSGGSGGDEDLQVAGTGRYIRVNATVPGTSGGYSLHAFEVGGTPTGH